MKEMHGEYNPKLLTEAVWKAAYRVYKKRVSKAGDELADRLEEWLEDWQEVDKELKHSFSQK
jgi:hypothetical protein